MHLTPKELDRLTIFTVAEMARRRRARGLKLNYPEAMGLLCDEMMEAARDGKSYEEVVALGMSLLSADDVMDGVPRLLDLVQVEPQFEDGTKLVVLRSPIRPRPGSTDEDGPGAVHFGEGEIEINAGRPVVTVTVRNSGAYPIQVTSHMHFYEVNRALVFDREVAKGHRLDVPAGSAVRWEPGDERAVDLIPFGPAP